MATRLYVLLSTRRLYFIILMSVVLALIVSACSSNRKLQSTEKISESIQLEEPQDLNTSPPEQVEILRLQQQDPDLYQQYRDNPKTLVGQMVVDMKAAFGFPDQIRHEKNITIFQYRSKQCVLDVFAEPFRRQKQIVYVETRDREGYRLPLPCGGSF